jgi:hypothetical protein
MLSEGKLADFTVQRTIPLTAGTPLVLVDIKLLAKIMPSAKTVVFRGFLAEKSQFSVCYR